MVKITYTMEIDIELEFDDTQIAAVDATDLVDYIGKAEVKLDDERVNILSSTLRTKE